MRVEAEVGKSDVPEIGGDDANLMHSAVSQMIIRIQRANLDIIFTDMPYAPKRFQIEEIEKDGEDFPDARGSKAVKKRSKLSPPQADSQPLQFPHLFSQGRLLLVTCTYVSAQYSRIRGFDAKVTVTQVSSVGCYAGMYIQVSKSDRVYMHCSLMWEGSMSREWLALVGKRNENEKFSPSLFFFIKLHFLAVTVSNYQVLFII